jgi:phosphoribosylformylglycinamidine synthase
VQVGDPFTEKLLIEACLELMAGDSIVAIQDMGAAGLTSSSVEMAGKGELGIELDLDQVPTRETGMTAYEIMLSESQERMLMILKPGREAEAKRIFDKWELDFAVIGRVTTTGHLVLKMHGEIQADLPVEPLVSEAPMYDRPWEPTPEQPELAAADVASPKDLSAALKQLLACPDLASKAWIWDQYDKTVMGDTIQQPPGDAALVRIHGAKKGLALTTDCTPRYCFADPARGGAQAVAETWRNITAIGATPIAITDNMNFGNPQKPRIMGQFVGCIEGMRAACLALDYPVVSGNVSLYNETNGQGILPTPAIGGVGLIEDVTKAVDLRIKAHDESIILIGKTKGHLGASLFLREIAGREVGAPPPVDLAAERANGDFVRGQILEGAVTACHDLSDGGLLIGLAEMAMAGKRGLKIEALPRNLPLHAAYFGEDQARYLLTTKDPEAVLAAAKAAGVTALRIGTTGGKSLIGPGLGTILVADLTRINAEWLPRYMSAEA